MDYTVDGESIRYIVNTSETLDEAKDRYVGLEEILMPKDVADMVFSSEVAKKFPPKKSLTAEVNDLLKRI